jgi:hypothetical protein
MVIPRIFHNRPRASSSARPRRRAPAGFSLELLSLEDRIPLSSGIDIMVPAPVVTRSVDIDWYAPAPAPVSPIEGVLVEVSVRVQGALQSLSEVDASIPSPSLTSESAPSLVSIVSQFDTGESIGADLIAGSSQGESETHSPGEDSSAGQATFSETTQTHPLLNQAVQVLDADGFAEIADHLAEALPGPPLIQDQNMIALLAFGPWRSGVVPNSNDDDESSADTPMGTVESVDGPAAWLTTAFAGARTTAGPSSLLNADLIMPDDPSTEVPATNGFSYLATAGSATQILGSRSATTDDLPAGDGSSNEPVFPASINAGGIALNVLLSDRDRDAHTKPSSLEQLVELVPLPESSLALAATLWSVPADSQPASDQWPLAADKDTAVDVDSRQDSRSSWAVFVIGMDRTLEQTCRDIQEGIRSAKAREAGQTDPASAACELIEWQGPILPIGQKAQPESPPRDRTSTIHQAPRGMPSAVDHSQPTSEDQQPMALGVVPAISALSISSLIGGWIWGKRRQRQRSRFAKAGLERS